VDKVARMSHRHRPLGPDHAGVIQALDVLHGEDKALAAPKGGMGGNDIGVLKPGDGADLAEKVVENSRLGPINDLESVSINKTAARLVAGQGTA
jgi:hypothetical protein